MQDRMPSIDSPDGLFHDGNPFTGEMGTIVTSAHLNDVQSGIQDLQTEAITLLAAAGMQPEPARKNQWLQALKALFLGRDDKARDSAALDGHPAAYFARASDQAAGLPLLFPLWCPNRAAIPAGYAPADGQPLARSLYPDAWAGIVAGNVPVTTDTAWLATPTERGKFTAGDGAGTFRLPDYNGKSAGTAGALFMRGDGLNSNGNDGVIQPDAFQSHWHRTHSANVGSGGVGLATSTTTLQPVPEAQTLVHDPISDGVNGTPRMTLETRPINVTGCWVIRLFGAVVNPGAADAAQLATEVSKLGADKVPFAAFLTSNQYLATSGYQRLPGGMIIQWGSGVDSVTQGGVVTYPIAFPTNVFSVVATTSNPSYAAAARAPNKVNFSILFNTSTPTSWSWMAIGN